MSKEHRAGFVSIIGKPNVGKSTLMNGIVGEHLSIITPKAQTTRHRIMGIVNGPDFQMIYSDTPGIIRPRYELHKSMMHFVQSALEDADVILFVTDIHETHDEADVLEKLQGLSTPIILLINKIDQASQEEVVQKIQNWQASLAPRAVIPVSALHRFNLESVVEVVKELLPVHPPYYGEDQLTDRPERFFASEIIREKIFLHYEEEIPYACEVAIQLFRQDQGLLRILADIMVERPTQKSILIGKGGSALKRVGTEARKDMEKFFEQKVFLELYVKVEEDWRKKSKVLRRFGYES